MKHSTIVPNAYIIIITISVITLNIVIIIVYYYYHTRKGKTMATIKRSVVSRDSEGKREE